MNSIVVTGNLCPNKDKGEQPILQNSKSGRPYVRFTLGVHRPLSTTAKTAGAVETDFIDCVAFNGQAEYLHNYKRKGDAIAVQGTLEVQDRTVQAVTADKGDLVKHNDGSPIMVNRRFSTVVCSSVEGVGIRPDHQAPQVAAAPRPNAQAPRVAPTATPPLETLSEAEQAGLFASVDEAFAGV